MNMNKKTKKAGMTAGTIIGVTIVIIAALGLTGFFEPTIAEPFYPDEHLFVDATYLLKTDETNISVDIACTLYLTNIWDKKSGDIKATAYVIESDKNFAVYKGTVEIGKISADSTGEVEIPIVLSNNSYKVEILLFEDSKLVIKGELTIRSYPVYVWKEVEHDDGVRQEQVLYGWDAVNTYKKFTQVR